MAACTKWLMQSWKLCFICVHLDDWNQQTGNSKILIQYCRVVEIEGRGQI